MRTYNRAELESIFETSRTDTYRKRLERAGYTFESGGRGDGYWIRITSLPEPPSGFEGFAKRELSAGAQSRFDAMEKFYFLLFNHEEFRYYPATSQSQFMEEVFDIKVCDQTLRNWKKKLIQLGWIALDDRDIRYYACNKGIIPREMDKEIYCKAWREFYDLCESGVDAGRARSIIYRKNDGMPRKQLGFAENAFYQDKTQELREILEDHD